MSMKIRTTSHLPVSWMHILRWRWATAGDETRCGVCTGIGQLWINIEDIEGLDTKNGPSPVQDHEPELSHNVKPNPSR